MLNLIKIFSICKYRRNSSILTLFVLILSLMFFACGGGGGSGSEGNENPATVSEDDENPNISINIKAIQGITPPWFEEKPVTSITETTQYTGTIAWSPDHTMFEAFTDYTATITLTPKSGFTLEGVAENFFTVDGATTVNNEANSGVITAKFPKTGNTAATVINIKAIQGITVPENGTSPVTAITGTAQYTGTVTWSPNDTIFAPGTAYTATITLTPKSGYTLQGVGANFFTVAGANSVSNTANSGVITVVFPATPVIVINIKAIQGITVPASGATCVAAITNTDQYTGTVTWDPAHGHKTFEAYTNYKATITLTAKHGYTLAGVGANFFTVAGATTTNSANSGVITAIFPKTGAGKGISSWTLRTSPASDPIIIWLSVCYGNGLFVAVANNGTGNRVMTSPDGINWTSRTSAADNSWTSVCYGNGLFVAVAVSGTGNRVMTATTLLGN